MFTERASDPSSSSSNAEFARPGGYKYCQIFKFLLQRFRFLGDRILGDGLLLIDPYI